VLSKEQEDQIASMAGGAPSWWPITTKEKWQDALQAKNWGLAVECRDLIQKLTGPREVADLLGIPLWAVMALVGMPVDRWWSAKDEEKARWAGMRMP